MQQRRCECMVKDGSQVRIYPTLRVESWGWNQDQRTERETGWRSEESRHQEGLEQRDNLSI